jgi:PadR family transcriptional regulator PadR
MPRPAEEEADAIERWEVQLRKGYLELAILACLWPGRLYGLEILRRLADGAGLDVAEGTLYPLLSRLKATGWLDSEWVEAQAGHPRKYYRLTPTGRRQLVRMARSWSSFAASIEGLLRPVREERR